MILDVFYIWTSKIAYVLLGILAASIAGTLSYLVWLFLEKETAKFHVRISMPFLRMALACFLIPIVPFAIYIFEKGFELGGEIVLVSRPMVLLLFIVVPICLVGLLVISMDKYWEYRQRLFLCFDNVPITDEKYLAMRDRWCKKLKIRKKIQLNFNEYMRSPAIMYHKGYQIVIPTYMDNDKEINMAILHELVHLKHGDLWTKRIGVVAHVLHRFNPYIKRLREEIEKWAEVDCDRDTCEIGKEEFERNEYYDCLLNLRTQSKRESKLKDMCGFIENQDLVLFRINAMEELKREEMKRPLIGYVVIWLFLVIFTVGSFRASYTMYEVWINLLTDYKEETLDIASLESSTGSLFTDTKLMYSDEDIFNQDDGLNIKIESKETWIFDVSGENRNEVYLDIRCTGGNYLVGGIGEDGQVLSMESSRHFTDWLVMNHGCIHQIFVQNLDDESIKIELFVLE